MCGAIVFHSPLSSTILKNQKESWKVQILNFTVAFLFDLMISQTNRKLKLANNGAASIRFLKVEPWILSPRYQFQDVNHFAFLSWERFPVDRKLHHQIRPHHKVTFSQARGTMPLWLVQAPLHFVFPDLQISVLAQQTDGNSRHLVQQEISSKTSQPIFIVNHHGFSNQQSHWKSRPKTSEWNPVAYRSGFTAITRLPSLFGGFLCSFCQWSLASTELSKNAEKCHF